MDYLNLLIKPSSSLCNMACKYCFYADVAQSREYEDYGLMSDEVLETIIKKAMDEAKISCSIGFQGGEPTLIGLDFFKRAVELVNKYNKNNILVSYSLQTNGILIDEKWAEFLAKNNFLTGLSIDGDEIIHDMFRVDVNNKKTHYKCMKAADILTEYGADFNILTVVTKQTAKNAKELYKFYKDNNFRFVQLIPCMDEFTDEKLDTNYSLSANEYGKFLSEIFDLWYNDFIKGDYTSIRSFDNFVRMADSQNADSCAMSGQCVAYGLIEANGNVYPCDFYALDKYKLGNIMDSNFNELLTNDTAIKFMDESKDVHQKCKTCNYFALCRGGCRRDREVIVGKGVNLNKYCSGYELFFEHTEQRIVHLANNIFGVR